MVTSTSVERSDTLPAETRGRNKGHSIDKIEDKSSVRNVETEPQTDTAKILAVGAAVPLGMAAAALATTLLSNQERVAIAAWVAATVVGSASVISAAVVSHRRTVFADHEKHEGKSTDRLHAAPRTKE